MVLKVHYNYRENFVIIWQNWRLFNPFLWRDAEKFNF